MLFVNYYKPIKEKRWKRYWWIYLLLQ